MDMTIIIPLYKPDKRLLKRVLESIKKQDYKGRITILKIEGKGGLAKQLNWGIKKSKTKIIVIMQQDCVIPAKDWLTKLVKPLEKKEFIASSSKVELPNYLWKKFDIVSRLFTAKEEGIIFPILGGKGDAYKKEYLVKAGLFDEENYSTAGEDSDMYLKINRLGKIAEPDIKILHIHWYNWKKRLQKELQYANGYGTYTRIHKTSIGKKMVIAGILKASPLIGWLILLARFPYKKVGKLGILWIPLSLVANFIYCVGFWRGFLSGKQKVYPD